MNLTEEQKQHCIDAGKFGIDSKRLAVLLVLPIQEVKEALKDSESDIYRYYSKGKVELMIEPLKALEKAASNGDVKAAKALYELKKKIEVDQMIDDYLER